MADFMDKLVSGINKSVANMSAGSKNISEKNKMNSEIKRLGEEIKEISSSLGINVYNYCATNPDKDIPAEQFATFIREISVRNHQINNCKNCQNKENNSAENVFCFHLLNLLDKIFA